MIVDPDYHAEFDVQAELLGLIIQACQSTDLTFTFEHAGANSLSSFLLKTLKDSFPHVQSERIAMFVDGLLSLHNSASLFKLHLKDFIISTKVTNESLIL